MKLNDYIYTMSYIISFFSIFAIVFAYVNNDKKANKFLLIFSLLSIIYMFFVSVIIHNVIGVFVKIDIIIIWLIEFIAGIFYLAAFVTCFEKRKKLKDNPKFNFLIAIVCVLIIAPVVLFFIYYNYENKVLSEGNIVVVMCSNGNGGFGDSDDFVYVVNDKNYNEISLEVKYNGYAEKYNYKKLDRSKIFDENNREKSSSDTIESTLSINNDYEVKLINDKLDNYLVLSKNNNIIHKIKLNEKYFNIEIEDIYYKES